MDNGSIEERRLGGRGVRQMRWSGPDLLLDLDGEDERRMEDEVESKKFEIELRGAISNEMISSWGTAEASTGQDLSPSSQALQQRGLMVIRAFSLSLCEHR